MPTLYMLCGVPYSGKSTWTKKKLYEENNRYTLIVLSTDDIISNICRDHETTYDESFKLLFDYANLVMNKDVAFAIKHGCDMIWDQTNLTVGSRAKKLARIPKDYRKVAINFSIPDYEELKHRVESRQDKIIPWSVMEEMFSQYVPATLEEGFDEVISL